MAVDSAPPSRLASPAEVEALAARVLPGMPLFAEGISHVAAGVVRGGDLQLFHVDHPVAPKSRFDRFLLDLSRLRAEAIVITGKILRDEPALSYAVDPGWADAFAALRRAHGLRERPLLAVLTRAPAALEHPLMSSPDVELTPLRASLADAIEATRARGARSISIEAGPSVASELYRPGSPLGELLFHRFEEALPEDALVGAFASEALVERTLGSPRSAVPLLEGSTRSVVLRYARA